MDLESIQKVIDGIITKKIGINTAIKILDKLLAEGEDINIINFAKAYVYYRVGVFSACKEYANNISDDFEYIDQVYCLLYSASYLSNDKEGMSRYKDYAYIYELDEIDVIKKMFYKGAFSRSKSIYLISNLKDHYLNDITAAKAEIEYESGNYDLAKIYASNYSRKYPNNRNNHMLFKINLMLGDIDEAIDAFNKAGIENQGIINFVDSMYSYIKNDLRKYDKVSFHGINKKNKELFDSFMEYFYKEDFATCEKILDELKNGDYQFFDVKPIKCLFDACKKTYYHNNVYLVYNELTNAFNEKDYDKMYSLLSELPSKYTSVSIVKRCVLALLINGNYDVSEIVSKIPSWYLKDIDKKIIDNGMIEYEKDYSDYLEYIDYIRIKGSYYAKNKSLDEAYDIYTMGYYVTEKPIILYMLCKKLYMNKKYDAAIYYLEEYIKVGYEKVNSAYYYLSICYRKVFERDRKHSDYKKWQRYLQITKSLNDIYGSVDMGYKKSFTDIRMNEEDFEVPQRVLK